MNHPFLRTFSLCIAVMLLAGMPALGQQASPPEPQPAAGGKDDPERQHALDVYHAGKFVEAMPLLEKLSSDHPGDIVLKECWAFSVMSYAATLSDADLRKETRVRARSIALEAKKLGDNSDIVNVVVDLPEDGSDPVFSSQKDVDGIMKGAEAEFVRGNFDKARDAYLHALLLDPKNYAATLFIGDVYFKQHINGSAGEWFARAIEIDPDRETAYRYWGDALMDLGKTEEARQKYIQAIVAEPYTKRSWIGLNKWTERSKLQMNWVRLQDKGSVERKDDSHTNITLDAGSLNKNDPSGSAWLIYAMNRALWQGDKFKKEFPNEPKYRRTLREEADCLHLMVSTMTGQKDFEKRKKNISDLSLLQLVQIDKAGFLEPFALLNRADNDIAQDYAPYRNAHRDTIYRYFDEFVVPKAPAQ